MLEAVLFELCCCAVKYKSGWYFRDSCHCQHSVHLRDVESANIKKWFMVLLQLKKRLIVLGVLTKAVKRIQMILKTSSRFSPDYSVTAFMIISVKLATTANIYMCFYSSMFHKRDYLYFTWQREPFFYFYWGTFWTSIHTFTHKSTECESLWHRRRSGRQTGGVEPSGSEGTLTIITISNRWMCDSAGQQKAWSASQTLARKTHRAEERQSRAAPLPTSAGTLRTLWDDPTTTTRLAGWIQGFTSRLPSVRDLHGGVSAAGRVACWSPWLQGALGRRRSR